MPTVDIVVDIYRSVSTSTSTGTKSPYVAVPHPGTGKLIEGWKWDKRPWSSDIELKSTDFAPTVFDPDTNFIPEESFLSGIGDNQDLKLLGVNEEQSSNIRYWVPRINHGYFYIHDQEWYLYSDDAVRSLMDASVVSGVLQYKDLVFNPKPTIPISVRRYKWNNEKDRYELALNFRKKQEWTGIITDEVEAETIDSNGYYQVANIDLADKEFIVDTTGDNPRVVLNGNYETQVGVSGTWTSLEFIGIGDGVTNEYHIPYSPVSPSGLLQLMTWDERTDITYSWSRIPVTSDFTVGAYNEFKLDDHLGIITFGDYDATTTSGAGAKPGALHQIGLVYTPGLELIYEPEYSRDWIEPRPSDVNPFHTPINQGFVKVTSQTSNPQWIQLIAKNIDGSAIDGYEMDLGNTTTKLVATVLSTIGEELEGEIVTFEILNPVFGTFSNLETTGQSITNSVGQASINYVPPATVDDIGVATTSVTNNGSDTFITAEGLTAPDRAEDIYLYKVMITDPVQGIPVEELDTYYSQYLTAEGITEDPDSLAATQDFEETFRARSSLAVPLTFDADDLSTGAKVIVATVDTGVLDPNYGIQNTSDPDYSLAAPIVPHTKLTSGNDSDPALELTYSGILDSVDDTTFKAYFVVCPAAARIRAKTTNAISGKVVYSNVITISINIPAEASGVTIIDNINEIQQGVISRVKHIDEIPDATILESSGELYSEYLEDRLNIEYVNQLSFWNVDEYTIGYWPMESGNLIDHSTFGNHLTNVGGMVPAAGLLGGAYRSAIAGSPSYLQAPLLYTDLDMASGTIDFMFRSGTDHPSGVSSKLFEFTVSGSNGFRNSLMGTLESSAASGVRFRFNYESSGKGNGPDAFILSDIYGSGIVLTDSEWHSVRATWGFNRSTSQVSVGARIDNIDLTGGVPTATLAHSPEMGTVVGGTVQAVVGDLSASGLFYFDEVRYSTTIRDDEWPPRETVASGESYIDWFKRTRKADTNRLLLQNMVASGYAPARLPHGFKLKSTGYTVASMLDRVTFITVNDPLPDDYFE